MTNYTNALKRVLKRKKINPVTGLKEPSMEGVFLTNDQLIDLGTQLKNTPNGPVGVCFMIGTRSRFVHTVDIIPFKDGIDESGRTIKFYESDGILGNILVNLGPAHLGIGGFSITNEGHSDDNLPPHAVKAAFGSLGSSQRTPPPFAP
jgi:hypothetical protein